MLYIVLMDCQRDVMSMANFEWRIKGVVEIEDRNSHLMPAERYVLYFKIFGLLFLVGLFGYNFKVFSKNITAEYTETNYAFLIVVAAVALKLISIIMDIVETYIYSGDGTELPGLNLMSKSTDLVSGYLGQLLTIYLAAGWTIVFSNIDDMELFLPITIAIGILKVIILGLGRLIKIEHYHYHVFDGYVGAIISAVQSGLFIYFIFLIRQ